MTGRNDAQAFSSILKAIEQANDLEINDILDTVIRRYRQVYPDWDIVFLSLPTSNLEERRRILQQSIALFTKYDIQ